MVTVALLVGCPFFFWDARRYPEEPLFKWLPLAGWLLLVLGLIVAELPVLIFAAVLLAVGTGASKSWRTKHAPSSDW